MQSSHSLCNRKTMLFGVSTISNIETSNKTKTQGNESLYLRIKPQAFVESKVNH